MGFGGTVKYCRSSTIAFAITSSYKNYIDDIYTLYHSSVPMTMRLKTWIDHIVFIFVTTSAMYGRLPLYTQDRVLI